MAIGAMSSKFTVNPRRNREGGTYDWGGINPSNMPKRLFGLSISVQEALSDFMLSHLLPGRYVLIDDDLTDQRARAVGMEKADQAAREVLLGAASERSKICIGSRDVQPFLEASRPMPDVLLRGERECKRAVASWCQFHNAGSFGFTYAIVGRGPALTRCCRDCQVSGCLAHESSWA
ncbi:hypothetical protein ACTMU2_05130 [Cupriavidus basilensis]